jgi:predicted RNase H-like nuclease (RuvC/YqgF family)
MRRALFFAVLLITPAAFTQDSPTAIAEREDARDRYKRMSAKIEDLENTIQTYNQQFQKMEAEIHRLRDEVSKVREGSRDTASKSDIVEQIKAVDRARMADQENVIKEFARLRKEILGTLGNSGGGGKTPKSNSSSPSPAPTAPTIEKGSEYAIREGDTLAKLVFALNKQGVKVNQKQVEQANPGVNWNKLKIGQKIFIPATPTAQN